jgi:hypothetical protein
VGCGGVLGRVLLPRCKLDSNQETTRKRREIGIQDQVTAADSLQRADIGYSCRLHAAAGAGAGAALV